MRQLTDLWEDMLQKGRRNIAQPFVSELIRIKADLPVHGGLDVGYVSHAGPSRRCRQCRRVRPKDYRYMHNSTATFYCAPT